MTRYVGLDVGLRTTALCIVDAGGAVRLERSIASEVDDIANCLAGLGEAVEAVALGTGIMTNWLTAGLRAAGHRVVVLEARQVKTTLSSLRNETDRNDARGIAQILRTGRYGEVHVKSLDSQRMRILLSARKALLRRCIDVEYEIRGLLKVFGIRLPARLRHGQYDRGVRDLLGRDPALAHAIEPLLDCRLRIYDAWRELERRVTVLAKEDRICRLCGLALNGMVRPEAACPLSGVAAGKAAKRRQATPSSSRPWADIRTGLPHGLKRWSSFPPRLRKSPEFCSSRVERDWLQKRGMCRPPST